MTLNPQAQRIYEILKDRQSHCPIEWRYADGHAKRITDINRFLAPQGLTIKSEPCKCGRHISRLLKRQIVPLNPSYALKSAPQTVFRTTATLNPDYCPDCHYFMNHSKSCPQTAKKEIQQLRF